MKTTMTRWLALFVWLAGAGSLLAHHSLANFDTMTAVRVKGTVVRVEQLNPHSFILLDQIGTDGQSRRWAAEGPSSLQLNRRNTAKELPQPGAVVEVCGYLPKEPIVWQIASADPTATSISGRLINAETLVMSDGQERPWGDYGVHKCFAPGYKDQHSR